MMGAGGEPSSSAGAAVAAASRATVEGSNAPPYRPGPHGGSQQPCYPNATCDAPLTCGTDFICRGTSIAEGGAPSVSFGGAEGSGILGAGAAATSGGAPSAGGHWWRCDDKHVRLAVDSASIDDFNGQLPATGWLAVDLVAGVFTPRAVARLADLSGHGLVGQFPSGNPGIGVFFDIAQNRSESRMCINVVGFDGISFWARTEPDSALDLDFDFVTPTSDPSKDWYAQTHQALVLSGEWRRYTVTFAEATLGYGAADFGELPTGSGGDWGAGGMGSVGGGTGGAAGLLNLGGYSGSGTSSPPSSIRGSVLLQGLAWIHRGQGAGFYLDEITFVHAQPSPSSQ